MAILESKKWLDENNITPKNIFNNKINDPNIAHIFYMNKELFPGSPLERKKDKVLQRGLYNYFINYYKNDLIEFLQARKINDPVNSVINPVNSQDDQKKIKWIGKPSQLAFFIGKLAELGYIDTPMSHDDEVNYSEFAKLICNTFDVKTTKNTILQYLNPNNERRQDFEIKLKEKGFYIPYKKEIS